MVSRVTLVSFALALSLSFSGCGRQVTFPKATGNGLAGEMEIRFRTYGPMDFNNINYVIVLNTSGAGGEPYANAFATTFCNYSFMFAVGPSYGNAVTSLYQVYIPPGSPNPGFIGPLTLAPGSTNLALNVGTTNGPNTEFDLTFARSQLSIAPPPGSVNPCSTATPAPSGAPTSPAQATWYVNLFTTNTSGTPLDALGLGVTDTSFSLPIDETQQGDQQIFRPAGIPAPPSNPSAYIAGVEIINTP